MKQKRATTIEQASRSSLPEQVHRTIFRVTLKLSLYSLALIFLHVVPLARSYGNEARLLRLRGDQDRVPLGAYLDYLEDREQKYHVDHPTPAACAGVVIFPRARRWSERPFFYFLHAVLRAPRSGIELDSRPTGRMR